MWNASQWTNYDILTLFRTNIQYRDLKSKIAFNTNLYKGLEIKAFNKFNTRTMRINGFRCKVITGFQFNQKSKRAYMHAYTLTLNNYKWVC